MRQPVAKSGKIQKLSHIIPFVYAMRGLLPGGELPKTRGEGSVSPRHRYYSSVYRRMTTGQP